MYKCTSQQVIRRYRTALAVPLLMAGAVEFLRRQRRVRALCRVSLDFVPVTPSQKSLDFALVVTCALTASCVLFVTGQAVQKQSDW